MTCGPAADTWAIVTGASLAEQWPAEFPPLQGWSISSSDDDAVIKSGVGSLYQFRQEISIYAPKERCSFKVSVDSRNGSTARLRSYLKDRGTIRSIAIAFPDTDVKRWVRVGEAVYTHQSGFRGEFSITLEQDHNRDYGVSLPGAGIEDDTTPPVWSVD